MARDTAATTFITGADGFAGRALVKILVARSHQVFGTFARLARRPRRLWRIPTAATRLVVGPVLADHIPADAVFSNIRLRGIGFRFQYLTLEQGLQQVLGALHE